MAPPFLTSALDGGEGSVLCPCRFIPGERAPGIHWIGGWVGPRNGLKTINKKYLAPTGNLTPVVYPVT
jgi:hypothetical protein